MRITPSRLQWIAIIVMISLLYVFMSISAQDEEQDEATILIPTENYTLEINRIWKVDEVDGDNPRRDIFLILETVLSNNTVTRRCFNVREFPAVLDDRRINPSSLDRVRDTFYPDIDIPGAIRGQCVDANTSEPSLLVYDLPGDLSQIHLEFNPSDEETAFTLWLNKQDNDDYFFVLLELDGERMFNVDMISIRETVEEVLDTETVIIENCNGVGDRESVRTISREVGQEITIGTGQEISREIGIPFVPLLRAGVSAQYSTENTESESLTFSVEESMSAPAGAIGMYEITWMLTSKVGDIEFTVGDETHSISFTMSDAIRAEVRSIPAPDCDETGN